MQVLCPNCGARYAVDPLAIGPVGRTVQCARCSHRWLQTVAAAAAIAAREAFETAKKSPEPAPRKEQDDPFRSSSSGAEADAERPFPAFSSSLGPAVKADKTVPIESIPDLVIRPPRERTSLPAVIEPRRNMRLTITLIVLAVVIAILLGAAAAGYFYRDTVMEKMPPAWRTFLHLDS